MEFTSSQPANSKRQSSNKMNRPMAGLYQLLICRCASASAAFIESIDSRLAGSSGRSLRRVLRKLWQPANEDRHSSNIARCRIPRLVAIRAQNAKVESTDMQRTNRLVRMRDKNLE